ncbi:MAG: acyltransferase [Candidatus Methylomirabilis oxygeniifera]|uniref:Nitrilase/cyanide hydratase and apolipoprotein N-acyltransferase n=1 Tax=Methylomirabilis oxygeniifera TaxID=671143 RepID=D5ML91_METO1|nr:MAG: acyltransferase [Candidatus Methylomirabilis oxyfera]CBE67757.1 Nitrilase/cyanide hydratase and apolipoprotein N-acyltransferase [Candidatus Methylomirabilis oxyfera]
MGMDDSILTMAGIQMGGGPDPGANLERAIELGKIAAQRGAKIICLSECFAWPWFPSEIDPAQFATAESVPGPLSETVAAFARDHQVAVVAPIFERGTDGAYYNTALVFDADGTLLGQYRKNHLPQLPNYQERFYFQPGNQGFPVFHTRYAVIGVQMSWDNFFPEGSRLLALQGAEVICAPTSASIVASHAKWERALVGSAVYNGVFVFRVNRVAGGGALPFYGKSFCVDPNGDFVADPSGADEGVVLAEIDLRWVKTVRGIWPFLQERRPEIYTGLT